MRFWKRGLLFVIGFFISTAGMAQAPVPPTATATALWQITYQCNVTGAAMGTAYAWTKEGGPDDVSFSSLTTPQTTVSVLTPGSYLFKCTVTDSSTGTIVTSYAYQTLAVANFNPPAAPASPLNVSIATVPRALVTDFSPPTITKVVFVANGSIVQPKSTVTLSAVATNAGFAVTAIDNVAVMSAQLLIDGRTMYSLGSLVKAPATFNLWWLDALNMAGVPKGTHDALIVVYDSSGNATAFSFKIVKP